MIREYNGKLLNQLFQKVEDVSNNWVNRGDLIMIDGTTIRERMIDEFLAAGNNPADFELYYRENVNDVTGRMVEEALLEEHYVEMFAVQSDGSIEGEPEQLKLPDVSPVRLDEEDMAFIENSRERVRMINLDAQHQMDKFSSFRRDEYIGDWMRENNVSGSLDIEKAIGENPRGLSVSRLPLISFSVLSLVHQGYSLDDIGDPNKLKEVKQAAGKEVISHIQSGDYAWLGETVMFGQKKLLDQLDDRLGQMDLRDNRQLLDPRNRGLSFMASCLSDVQQEVRHFMKEAMDVAAKMNPDNPQLVMDDFDNRATTLPSLFKKTDDALNVAVVMSNGNVPPNAKAKYLGGLTNGEFIIRQYAKEHTAHPNVPYSRLFSTDSIAPVIGFHGCLSGNETVRQLNEALDDPMTVRSLGRELLSGNLQRSMDMEVEPETLKASFNIERAPKHIRDMVYQGNTRIRLETELPKFEMDFSAGIVESVAQLQKADPPLLRSSEQYKSMQACAQYMSRLMRELDNPPTYLQAKKFHLAAESMKESVEEYLEYKERKHSGSSREQKRIRAAKDLLKLSNEMLQSGEVLLQGFDRIPEMREAKEQFEEEERQRDIAAAENVRKAVEGNPVLKQQFKEMEAKEAAKRNEETAIEITDYMTGKYGSSAPDAYRVPGSMMEIKTSEGKTQSVSAVGKLGQDIMRNKDSVIRYINGDISISKQMRDQMFSHIRHTMARMVLMEQIVIERAQKGFKPGQARAEAGILEQTYAKNPKECLKSVGATEAFRNVISDMSPEKLKDFVMNDGAKVIARKLQAEAKEKSKVDNSEKQIQHRISEVSEKRSQILG